MTMLPFLPKRLGERAPRPLTFQFYDNVAVLLHRRDSKHILPLVDGDLGRNSMATALLFAGALLAQSALPAVTVTGELDRSGLERSDVAFEELSQGRNDEAIARITQNRELASDDPAAMINLGTAYARTGRDRDAQRCFQRAIASRDHYDLELANGQWMNSRQAARKATTLLRSRQTLALAPRR